MEHGKNNEADRDFNLVANSCTFLSSPQSQKTYENKRRQVCVKVRQWETGCEKKSLMFGWAVFFFKFIYLLYLILSSFDITHRILILTIFQCVSKVPLGENGWEINRLF